MFAWSLIPLTFCLFNRIKNKLDQGGLIQDFINALDQLSNPDLIFKVIEQLVVLGT